MVSDKVLRKHSTGEYLLSMKFSYKKQAVEATKQKEEKMKKPKPEEQEGMPQCHHCPPAKRRGDRNPKFHEAQQKDVT
jgi:hypothetical protein